MKPIKEILEESGFKKGMSVEELQAVMAERRHIWEKKNLKNL